MSEPPRPRPGRRPGATSSREDVLRAARELFAERGYRGATLRAIADRAGGDPALVRHFFGDKDGLFAASLELPSELPGQVLAALEGDVDTVGERVSRAYLSTWEDPVARVSLIAVFRSAMANEKAMDRLQSFLASSLLRGAARSIPGERPQLRLALAMSHLLGVATARHVMSAKPVATVGFEELVRTVAPSVQLYLSGPTPAG